MALGARLKNLRMKTCESLKQLADALGVSKAHIWELETGKSANPSMDLLIKLADHFETSVSALIGEDPAGSEDPQMVAMFRDLKELDDRDLAVIKQMIKSMKKNPHALIHGAQQRTCSNYATPTLKPLSSPAQDSATHHPQNLPT